MKTTTYAFRDSRRIFKWMYWVIGFNIVLTIRGLILNPETLTGSLIIILFYGIIFLIIRRNTATQAFVSEARIEMKKILPFYMITEITASDHIIISSDRKTDVLKLYDLENNYDKYLELLEFILARVDKEVALRAGSAEELLQQASDNLKEKYNSRKLSDGRVELGGWLSFFNVMAYITVIVSPISVIGGLVSYFAFGEQTIYMVIRMIIMFAVELTILILLSKRKNKVKYFLPMSGAVVLITNIVVFIISVIKQFVFVDFVYDLSGIIINSMVIYLMFKIYIEYIDTFERPKQTLTN